MNQRKALKPIRFRTPINIATDRARSMRTRADRVIFRDTFLHVHDAAQRLARRPLGDWLIEDLAQRLCREGSVQEAAVVEALAVLRAEGHRL